MGVFWDLPRTFVAPKNPRNAEAKCQSGAEWPTLAKLNEELFPYPWSHNKEFNAYLSDDSPFTIPRKKHVRNLVWGNGTENMARRVSSRQL